MWEGQVRTDGLLRGTRDERIQQMLALKNQSWNLDALLELHCGLLDHAHEVREAAMETLLELAAQQSVAVPVTPTKLLAYYMGTFTVASGIDVAVVQCLAGLRNAEADELLIELLESGRGSNEQFRRWLEVLNAADRQDIIRRVRLDKLSAGRKKMVHSLLRQ
jgi:hypothetical protein